ncbi:DUF2255 family protein [Sphaerisporangium fuscum]|uniref:DUF2255 family protein n=1 Tax=Sphaerisporangium fuscum TaxID=2835868 RepID=UPI001BDCC397|nr:DUF2255 family protein [Sphaerisporangium fuscum]
MEAYEITLCVRHADGSWSARPIWVVTVTGESYVRSAFGERSAWYRRARTCPAALVEAGGAVYEARLDLVEDAGLIDRVSAAYRAKYGPSWPGPAETMTGPEAAGTTMRLTDVRQVT